MVLFTTQSYWPSPVTGPAAPEAMYRWLGKVGPSSDEKKSSART
jgi:hypothetical protein